MRHSAFVHGHTLWSPLSFRESMRETVRGAREKILWVGATGCNYLMDRGSGAWRGGC
jgi:hypothetical protein